MKKLLWIGDGVASTGFARVSDSVLARLSKYYEVHHLAINYRGDPHGYNYKVYPAFTGGDLFGFGRLVDLTTKIKPDIIIMLQDPWFLDIYLEKLKELETRPKIITYFPVDAAGLNPMWFRHFDIVSKVILYTEYGRSEVQKLFLDQVCCKKLAVIPHGIDTNTFYEIPMETARRKVFPDEKVDAYLDKFIVLNANRNQPRKRIDLTIFGFSEFARDKEDVMLYLHMGRMDEGWDIIELMRKMQSTSKLILTTLDTSLPNVSVERLNYIYNATDVGINTSIGEGWGLVNWEHGATGKPQIVPNHSACFELWNEKGGFLFPAREPYANPKICTIGKVATVSSIATTLESAYQMWKKNRQGFLQIGQEAKSLVTDPRYSWDHVAELFKEQIESVLNGNSVSA